jgi:hypothetical protein
MFKGAAPGAASTWKTDSLGNWAANEVVKNKEDMDFWVTLGLGSLAAAAFIFAEIATLGTATFFIAASVGLAATGAEVAQKWEKYSDLAAAGQTNVSDKTALVDPSQVDEAMIEASIATAMAILAAVGVAAKGFNVLRGVKEPVIDLAKPMSATGEYGSLAGRKGFGVFEGRLPWVQKPVAIKVYPESMAAKFEQDLAGARVAARSGGPKCYGEVPAGPGKRAFAMEKVEGGFTNTAPTGKETAAELLAAEKEANLLASKVSQRTVGDLDAYKARLLKNGHYYDGEVQGLVDAQGRWRPIDFQPIKRLPTDPASAEYAQAIRTNDLNFASEHDRLAELAGKNAAKTP